MSAVTASPANIGAVKQARTPGIDPALLKPRKLDARHRRGASRWIVLIVVSLMALGVLIPLILMLLNAFKPPLEYAQNGPLSIPTSLHFDGLIAFWQRTNFTRMLVNSVLISAAVAVGGTLLSLLNAYAIGIGKVKGKLWIVALFLVANMLPQEAIIYPLFDLARQVGLSNSQWSVIIIFTVIQSAFGTYLLSSVLGTFPPALLEAAALDGAGRWRILWKVVFPIVRPTLAVLMIFFFIWTWNEFFIPLVFLTTPDTQTVPIALAALQGDRMLDVPTMNAGAFVSLLPTLIFFLLFQRTLTRGVTAGAVK
jgi:raffinose/stachyose/melibiose transport system permease protein